MSKRTVQTLVMLVDNEFGVLTRITAMVRREGWNTKSLVVAETVDPAVSRLTLCVECLDSSLLGMIERLGKLNCVRRISTYSETSHISRELMLATVPDEGSAGATAAARAFAARTTALPAGGLLVEFTGAPAEVDALLRALTPHVAINVARSGVVALEQPGEEAKP